jgi:uncharacterized SAM-binding protein YcdF (DUF218 family)
MGAKNECELQYKLNPCSWINLTDHRISYILSCTKSKALIIFCCLFIYLVPSVFFLSVILVYGYVVPLCAHSLFELLLFLNDIYFIVGTVERCYFISRDL